MDKIYVQLAMLWSINLVGLFFTFIFHFCLATSLLGVVLVNIVKETFEGLGGAVATTTILITDEAMKNGSARETEDRQEKRGNQVWEKSYEHSWDEWLLHQWEFILGDQEGDPCWKSHNSSLAKDHHDPSNHTGRAEPSDVSNDQVEWVPCRSAEVSGVQSNLNEGVLGDEFHVLVKAPKDASHNASYTLVNCVIFASHCFIFLSQVFENNSDHGD